MSLEFSGQTTTSRSSPARASVPTTWLSRTLRRSALKSSPARGTLPWTRPTRASVVAPSGAATSGAKNESAPSARATGTDTRSTSRRRTTTRTTGSASTTTARLTSGAPPRCARRARWLSACPKASRAHGKPPKGVVPRSSSWITHAGGSTMAAGTTRPARISGRWTRATTAPKPATYSASRVERAIHGKLPTKIPLQCSVGRNIAHPARRPRAAPARTETPHRATPSSAMPTIAATCRLRSGKDSHTSSPPPTDSTTRRHIGVAKGVGSGTPGP